MSQGGALADVSLVEEGWGPGRGRWSGHSLSWLLLPFGHSCSAVFFRKKSYFYLFCFLAMTHSIFDVGVSVSRPGLAPRPQQ